MFLLLDVLTLAALGEAAVGIMAILNATTALIEIEGAVALGFGVLTLTVSLGVRQIVAAIKATSRRRPAGSGDAERRPFQFSFGKPKDWADRGGLPAKATDASEAPPPSQPGTDYVNPRYAPRPGHYVRDDPDGR